MRRSLGRRWRCSSSHQNCPPRRPLSVSAPAYRLIAAVVNVAGCAGRADAYHDALVLRLAPPNGNWALMLPISIVDYRVGRLALVDLATLPIMHC